MDQLTPTPGTPPRRTTAGWIALGGALVLLGWLDVLLPRAEPLLAGLLLAAGVALGVGARRTAQRTRWINAAAACGTLVVVGKGVWLVAHWAPAWIVGQAGAILAGFCCVGVARRRATSVAPGRTAPRAGRRLAGAATLGALGVAALISLALVVTAVTTDPLFQLSGLAGRNAVSAPAPARTPGPRGTVRISDVRYGSEYPNSVLDVYLTGVGPAGARPTFVYIHGGGYILGDKVTGDPHAGAGGYAGGQGDVLALGYNVVQLNYAFAPAYKYPTALTQVAQAVAFLRRHAAAYGLDMTRVVVGGGSAGGHAAGQFALLQTDPAYARAVGIPPVLDPGALKAVVLESAALDPSRAATTQTADLAHDFQFGAALRSYFGVAGPVDGHTPSLAQANVIAHVTANFPTTFVADGNFGTFPDQARDLAARLTALGVPCDLVLYDGVAAKLGHSFMILPSRWTDDYLAKKHAFLRRVLATGGGA